MNQEIVVERLFEKLITGDRAAWNADWGYLTDLSKFPTGGLVSHGD